YDAKRARWDALPRKSKPKSGLENWTTLPRWGAACCAPTRARETQEHSPFEVQGKQEWLCHKAQGRTDLKVGHYISKRTPRGGELAFEAYGKEADPRVYVECSPHDRGFSGGAGGLWTPEAAGAGA